MSTSFTVTVRATSLIVTPGGDAIYLLQPLLDMLTYEDEYVEETKTLGYMYDEETDQLFLHKGVDLIYLRRLLINVEFVHDPYHDYKEMAFEYEEIISPRNDEQVDVINFIAGLNQHSSNVNDNQLFLVKSAGFGKAQPYSSEIPTPTEQGYTLMGNLKVGDYIFDRTGKPTRVIDIFEQGEQDIYKITFQDKRTVMCCKEHLWGIFIDNINEYSIYQTQEMIKLIKHGHVLYTPINQPAQYPDFYYDNYPAYDTSTNTYKFSSPEKVNRLLKDFGIIGVEGCVSFPLSTSVNLSPDISIKEILPLLYQMGYSAYYEFDENTNTHKLYYSKPDKLKIINIELSHKEKSRCIMVDNPEHLYLTENFIVTHNTFCTGVGICKFKAKTLIIMHRDNLRKQWLNSLYNMSGLSSKYVHEISSSEELYNIAHNKHDFDYDVYLMTHATFRAGLRRIQKIQDAMNITKNLGIGVKIIDEAHLEFRDTLLMDFIFNVKRNIYLTATDGRSSKEENSIFRHVFSNCIYYKPSSLLTNSLPKKWVNYISVFIDSKCNPNIYRYRVAGGRGMNNASYGKWVISYDKKKTHFKCCKDIVKLVYDKDPHAKVLLFMPLIDLCEECSYFLKMVLGKDPSFDYELDIRTINSKNSKSDNEYAKKSADIIVTTIASCGTGTDIPGITTIISCSPYKSAITAEQVHGRIRYCGKICEYYDIIDNSVPMDKILFKCRSKTLKHLSLNTKAINWTPDE